MFENRSKNQTATKISQIIPYALFPYGPLSHPAILYKLKQKISPTKPRSENVESRWKQSVLFSGESTWLSCD